MTRLTLLLAASLSVGLVAGCNQSEPGRSRLLGDVERSLAYSTARSVLARYYSLEPREPDSTSVIRSRPKPVQAPGDRLLGGYPAREIATLRLLREENGLVAHLSIAEQRQRAEMHRGLQREAELYDGVPNRTPAYDEAATTAGQNENWETRRYEHAKAARILAELYRELHPDKQP